MAHQVEWNKYLYDFFCEHAMLSEEEKFVLLTRIQGWTVTQQAMQLSKSPSSVANTISKLKKKYDSVQSQYPNELPKRKTSAKELYMDNN